jgi:hypothetical protein
LIQTSEFVLETSLLEVLFSSIPFVKGLKEARGVSPAKGIKEANGLELIIAVNDLLEWNNFKFL